MSEVMNPQINPKLFTRIIQYSAPKAKDLDKSFGKHSTIKKDDYQSKAKAYLAISEKWFEHFERLRGDFLPTDNRLKHVYKDDPQGLVHAMEETHIVMHKDLLHMINKYCKLAGLNPTKYVKRLIRDRPLAFLTASDRTLPRFDLNGGKFIRGPVDVDEWKTHSNPKYIRYSDMLFASLLQVSSPTRFINDCNRFNEGRLDKTGNFISQGQIVALVGARFEVPDRMDSLFMLIQPNVNVQFDKLGRIEKTLYEYYFSDGLGYNDFEAIKNLSPSKRNDRYVQTKSGNYLDKIVYAKRLRLIISPYILDANEVAKKAGKIAYLYVTGWGMGAWAIAPAQGDLFLKEFFKVLTDLDHKNALTHISDVHFAWIENEVFYPLSTSFKSKEKIRLVNNKANPGDLANFDPKTTTDKMLFFSFAWDGNSYPGNEYWIGWLSASGDPAAASCSTIPESQNPQINEKFLDRQIVH